MDDTTLQQLNYFMERQEEEYQLHFQDMIAEEVALYNANKADVLKEQQAELDLDNSEDIINRMKRTGK
jgi:hypothetical protein